MPSAASGIASLVLSLAVFARVSFGQTCDRGARPSAELLTVPSDGVAYYQMRNRARALIEQGRAAEARPILEQLTHDYPRDGGNWLLLSRTDRLLSDFSNAARALEQAGCIIGRRSPDLRFEPSMAALHLSAGNTEAALDALSRAVFVDRSLRRSDLFQIPPLAPLRSDARFQSITGHVGNDSIPRDEGRRRDLDYLYAEVRRVSPDYRDAPFPAEFASRYEELKRNASVLSPEEFVVGVNRMLAALHQGHTELAGGLVVHHLPVQFYVFPEGLFIVQASPDHRDLVGSRVVSFGRTPAEEALRLVNLMQSVDGDMQYLWTGAFLLRSAEYLKGSGIDVAVDNVDITVEERSGQRRTVTLSGPNIEGWTKLPAPAGVTPPLFLRNLTSNHWETALPAHDAIYAQINQMRDDSLETLAAFGRRLWVVLEQSKARNLIIDLRQNDGGNTSLYTELLRTIIAFTRGADRRLFVMIGRTTYSAAANFIMDLERLANPIFVGEASSECCNFHGDAAHVALPNSGLHGFISGVRWNLSKDVFDGRREMSPDVPVQLTAKAYFSGQDPALEAVFKLLATSPQH